MAQILLRCSTNLTKHIKNPLLLISCSTENGQISYSKTACKPKVCKARRKKILTLQSMHENTIKMQFAVRGSTLKRAMELKEELDKGLNKKRKFKEIIFTNQGDFQAQGTSPNTFLRQVVVLCLYPYLLQDSRFGEDAKKRAKAILSSCLGSSMGAYSQTQGLSVVREHISDYIFNRDSGIPSNPNNIFIQDGASIVIKNLLGLFDKVINGKPTGVLIPIPNYPLFSASLDQLGLYKVGYYLDEKKNWNLNIKHLEKVVEEGRCNSVPRVMVVINPGNPTGQVLSRQNITDIIKFAYREKLFIFADEVYQQNIYDEYSDFYSFKKVKHELGPPYSTMELASFFSASKGTYGESGLRAGYVELDCMDKAVQEQFLKASSVMLGANTVGQAALSCIVKPPVEGDDSYEEFIREKCCILNGLMAKARLMTNKLNAIKGIKTNPVQGAVYAYGKIEMPKKAISEAKKRKLEPSEMWCLDLLESTGIVVVPGSAFGQKPGSYYFRTTILPPFEVLEKMTSGIKHFQEGFMQKFKP